MIIPATTTYWSATVNEHHLPFIFSSFPLHCGLAAILLSVYTVILLCCILFYDVKCAVDPFQCLAETSNTAQSEWRHLVLKHIFFVLGVNIFSIFLPLHGLYGTLNATV